MKEYFKPISGFEGYYSISNKGRVFSHKRTITRSNGVKLKVGGLFLKPATHKGYFGIRLRKPRERQVSVELHRVIATHFISNPHDLPQVNHKNGIKTDNSLDNLEWCTASQNIQHAYDNNLMVRNGAYGIDNKSFKGSIEGTNLADGSIFIMTGSVDIGMHGFSPCKVYSCANGRRKTHKNHSFRRLQQVQQNYPR